MENNAFSNTWYSFDLDRRGCDLVFWATELSAKNISENSVRIANDLWRIKYAKGPLMQNEEFQDSSKLL